MHARVRWGAAAVLSAIVVASVAACAKPDPPPAPPPETTAHGVVITPTGIVAPILSSFDGGYWVRTPCFGVGLVLGDPDEIVRIDRATIVLDPGHGGPEQGALGANGLEEKEVNLAVAQLVAQRLREDGIDTVLTRTGDASFVTLRTRAEIATALAPQALVAIHHNSSDQPQSEVPGSETYFQIGSTGGERLAQWIYQDLVAGFERFDIDWVRPGDAGAKYRQGDDGDYYGLLRYSKPVVAVISEGLFVSNPAEADFLRTPEARRAEADSITTAIRRYLDDPAGSAGATTTSASTSTTLAPVLDDPAAPPASEVGEAETTTTVPAPVPGTIPVYAPAADAEGCVDPPLF